MKNKKNISLWEAYLTREIGIEFKACLYFFAILFYYCVYRMACGVFDASIIHMAELILTCYVICYLQVYLFGNFDEADKLRGREIAGMIVCTVLYTAVSYIGKWFDRKIPVTLGFVAYILFMYICVVLIYRTKRKIDDKKLNEDLKIFQADHKK
ncbi:MAG: DUF3021 family protein [Lachnospiraceae bacterium]|nr:DUF3021 family protein [Lachnospiraceae bacterium]